MENTLTNTKVPQYQLFDLNSDPEEKHDLSAQFPQKLQELTARLADVIAAAMEPATPGRGAGVPATAGYKGMDTGIEYPAGGALMVTPGAGVLEAAGLSWPPGAVGYILSLT